MPSSDPEKLRAKSRRYRDKHPDVARAATKRWKESERGAEMRVARTARLLADADDPAHGTLNGYDHGCRCERCRSVRAAYVRQRRVRLRYESRRAEGAS